MKRLPGAENHAIPAPSARPPRSMPKRATSGSSDQKLNPITPANATKDASPTRMLSVVRPIVCTSVLFIGSALCSSFTVPSLHAALPASPSRKLGRGRGNRTPNLRFWRPTLCQLSYAPSGHCDSFTDDGFDTYVACHENPGGSFSRQVPDASRTPCAAFTTLAPHVAALEHVPY
ncbi:hypothetical protein SBBP2_910002 [Burkholderiales bacterium]|nr:hypothetical protein SBBP2_910002 [Burkholderiales bacterium]